MAEINTLKPSFFPDQSVETSLPEAVSQRFRQEFRSGDIFIGKGVEIKGEGEERKLHVVIDTESPEYKKWKDEVSKFIEEKKQKAQNSGPATPEKMNETLDLINSHKQEELRLVAFHKTMRIIRQKEKLLIGLLDSEEKTGIMKNEERTSEDYRRLVAMESYCTNLCRNGAISVTVQKPGA